MRMLLLGINHRTAPLAVRERLSFAPEDVPPTLRALRDRYPACEAVLLSTCNRVEVYVARATDGSPSSDELRRFLAERSGVEPAALAGAAVHREQEQAVLHLFQVATGLDSMVLGEPQVLGQVKRAYDAAAACGAAGPVMHRVFQGAIAAAKRVRHDSGIGVGRTSVATVAVDFARQIFEGFADKTIVGIGAGEMAKATLRHLLRLSPGRLWVVNRSLDRAAALAGELGLEPSLGGARPWDDLDTLLVEADVVLTGTGAREPIITAERFRPLLRKRRRRPLLIVDTAVPRDVEAEVGSLANVYLYNIDDLQGVVTANLGQRGEVVEQCRASLAEAAAACYRQVQHRDVADLIRRLRDQLHDIGEAEGQRTARKLDAVAASAGIAPESLRDLLDEHTHRVVNKILHLPLSQLDHRDPDAPLAFYAAALRRLFQLDDGEPAAPEAQTDPPPAPRPATPAARQQAGTLSPCDPA